MYAKDGALTIKVVGNFSFAVTLLTPSAGARQPRLISPHQSRFLFDHSMVCRAFCRVGLFRHTAPILDLKR